jgi:hypothetical protein
MGDEVADKKVYTSLGRIEGLCEAGSITPADIDEALIVSASDLTGLDSYRGISGDVRAAILRAHDDGRVCFREDKAQPYGGVAHFLASHGIDATIDAADTIAQLANVQLLNAVLRDVPGIALQE